MKKIMSVLLTVVFILTLASCGGTDGQATELDASSIVLALQEAGLPLNNEISYTAESDPAALLGTKKQYTSKTVFADLRINQYDESEPLGGAIEVFENSKNAQSRVEYLESVFNEMPEQKEYLYSIANVVLRLNGQFELSEADEYYNVLGDILGVADYTLQSDYDYLINVGFQNIEAGALAEGIAAMGLPMYNIIVFTAETDPNELLGQPNAYTGKASWADYRMGQYAEDDPTGGTIEVFATEADALSRYNYISEVYESMPSLRAHMYLVENVLLRVETENVSEEEFAEYVGCLNSVLGIESYSLNTDYSEYFV